MAVILNVYSIGYTINKLAKHSGTGDKKVEIAPRGVGVDGKAFVVAEGPNKATDELRAHLLAPSPDYEVTVNSCQEVAKDVIIPVAKPVVVPAPVTPVVQAAPVIPPTYGSGGAV